MTLKPLMLAKKLTRPFEYYQNAHHCMEPKLDGMRVGVQVKDGKVTIYSRTFKTQEGKLPHLEKAFMDAGRDFELDGEIVYISREVDTPQGSAPLGDFNKTMRIMGSGANKAAFRQNGTPLTFVAFDLLSVDNSDLINMPENSRRQGLVALFHELRRWTEHIRVLPRYVPDMRAYTDYVAAGGEGMMLKDTHARYVGKRSAAWIKVKAVTTEDVVITGYKEGRGKYSDTIGAVVFSQYDQNGNLIERGACSGMTDELRYLIGNNQDALIGTVMEIRHFGYSSDAKLDGLRHPQFVTFRDDKLPEECVMT